MKKLFSLAFLVGALGLGWLAWNLFFPSVEKVLRQKMATLAETVTFNDKTNPITRAAKAQKVIAMFATDAQVTLDASGYGGRNFSGREEISEAVGMAFGGMQGLRVEFLDVNVQVAGDKQTANIGCTAKIFFGGSKDFGVQEMRFQFKKVDGTWLIHKVETVKTLT